MIIDIRKNINKIKESGSNYSDVMESQLKRVASYLKIEEAISKKLLVKKENLGLTD